MKKIIALIMVLMLVGIAFAEDSMTMQYNGQSLTLPFDTTGTYSFIKDGYVDATFYYIDMTSLSMYEMMLYFPEDVAAGTVISSEDTSIESGLYFADGDMVSQNISYAEINGGVLKPSGASYTITFSAATVTDTEAHYEGTFSAKLITVDESENPVSEITIENATFSCTISKTSADTDVPDVPNIPETTPDQSESPEPQTPFATPEPKAADKTIYKV